MNRRKFSFLAGTAIATTVMHHPATAQAAAPDASLLTTTLTPYGAERAGSADGSIPAWTGGNVAPTTTPDQLIDVQVFTDEQPLYTVTTDNLAQYQQLVTPGLQAFMAKSGFNLRVFPCHRTAAAPQYVYDNIAKNVARAQLDPAGGRFGFVGAFGGIPFPIIDIANPGIGGCQLIWNHLTQWEGFSNHSTFSPAVVVSSGNAVLSNAEYSRFMYPYYDPNGSPETFEGYYSKLHIYTKAPANIAGQEQLVWHSTNTTKNTDIVWELLNGQGRVRKAPDEAYDTPNPLYNGISNVDESQGFYGSPQKYDWTYIAKQEMLIPYNCNELHYRQVSEFALSKSPNPAFMRWEKHRVWVIEATLHPGERNVLSKRRFYLDEDTYGIVLGEAYDADGNMTRMYMNPIRTVPGIPMNNPVTIVVASLITGDYVLNGQFQYGNIPNLEYEGPQPGSDFDAEQMSAGASF